MQETLIEAGFSQEAALKLSGNSRFSSAQGTRSASEISEKVAGTAKVYKTPEATIRKAMAAYPAFITMNHSRVIGDISKAYGCSATQARLLVLTDPVFSGRDHRKGLIEVAEAYNCTKAKAVRAIMAYPALLGHDHQKVLNDMMIAYGHTRESAAKAAISYPQMVGVNPFKAVDNIMGIYGWTRQQAQQAVRAHSRFVSYDHAKKLRRLAMIGRIIGIDEDRLREELLKKPELVGHSIKRHLAVIDVFLWTDEARGVPNEELLQWWLKNYIKSPYVPDTERLRITQALRKDSYTADPALMSELRKGAVKLRAAA